MSEMRPVSTLLTLAIVAALILAGLALLVTDKAARSREELPYYGTVPEFEFIDHRGDPFETADLKGKISVVYFGFTRCKGPCPIVVAKLKELYDLYAGSDGVQFVMISVDPDNDTLETMQQYVEDHGMTDGRFILLRGPIEEVRQLCEGGFMLGADDLPGGHSTKVAVVDHTGQIRSYHNGVDPESMNWIREPIRHLARAMP